MSDKPYAAIPEPSRSVDGLYDAVSALKQAVEILAGVRGNADARALTWGDLRSLGMTSDNDDAVTVPYSEFNASVNDLADLTDVVTSITPVAVATNTVQSNISGVAALPSANGLSAVIDSVFGNTRGAVLYRGASGWAKLDPGAAGYALTSQGSGADPVYAASGAWTKIATLNVAGLTNADITNLDGYAALRVTLDGIIPSSNAYFSCRLSSDNGASFYTTDYRNMYAADTTMIALVSATPVNPIGGSYSGYNAVFSLFQFAPPLATQYTAYYSGGYIGTDGLPRHALAYGGHSGTTAMNALRFYLSTGTFASGRIIVEGLA